MTASPDHESPRARRTPRILQSLNWAFEGVIHVLRTQRNMRIHFAVATVVLILAFSYGVTKLELMALLVAISFVLIAEMVNTAIEATIDLGDHLLRPAREGGEGHRRRRSPHRRGQRHRHRLPRLRRPSVDAELAAGRRGCARRRAT